MIRGRTSPLFCRSVAVTPPQNPNSDGGEQPENLDTNPAVHEGFIGIPRRRGRGLLPTTHRRHQNQAPARPDRFLQGNYPLRHHHHQERRRAGHVEGAHALLYAFDAQIRAADGVECGPTVRIRGLADREYQPTR